MERKSEAAVLLLLVRSGIAVIRPRMVELKGEMSGTAYSNTGMRTLAVCEFWQLEGEGSSVHCTFVSNTLRMERVEL